MLIYTINQLFTSAQHLLLLILGLHVSTDHSVIFRSLICYKFQGAVHIFGIPIAFTLKLNAFISVGVKTICKYITHMYGFSFNVSTIDSKPLRK